MVTNHETLLKGVEALARALNIGEKAMQALLADAVRNRIPAKFYRNAWRADRGELVAWFKEHVAREGAASSPRRHPELRRHMGD